VTDTALPWHVTVLVADIPDAGLHRDLQASEAERAAVASLAGLRDLPQLGASFELTPAGAGRIRVHGRVSAQAGQTCVVTLEPMTSEVDEEVDVIFSDEPQPVAAAESEEALADDPPEPIVNGAIDLGALATEFLMLGLDPYPRKDGAVFEPVIAPVDPADHPFAALKALKDPQSTDKPKSGSKTKGK
jgi:uncharacterized metal-binding protein YceD (DUF177 family)